MPAPGRLVVGPPPQKVEDNFIAEPAEYRVEPWVENLEIPWALAFLPDGRALATERPGRIRVIRDRRLDPEPYATVEVEHIGEGGLMGLAVHPEFPDQPWLYVMYTHRDGGSLYNRVDRLRDTGGTAEFDRVIVDRIPGHRVHDGGRIAFGPDGMLYVCTGDIWQAEIALDRENLGGKILRYTPTAASLKTIRSRVRRSTRWAIAIPRVWPGTPRRGTFSPRSTGPLVSSACATRTSST